MKKLLLSIIGITAFLVANSQTSPTITGISYNKENKMYTISWNDPIGADKYEVYTYSGTTDGGNTPKYKYLNETIDPNITISLLPDTIIFFAVEAVVGNNRSEANLKKWPWKDAPSNVILKYQYNSCDNELTLSWNRNYGFSDPVYRIFCNDKEVVSFKTDTFHTFNSKDLNSILTLGGVGEFQVDVYDKTTGGSLSSSTATFTKPIGATLPKYIEATGTTVWEEPIGTWTAETLRAAMNTNKISLSFQTDTASTLKNFIVYRSSINEVTGFERLNQEGVEIVGDPIATYTDETIDSTGSKQYYYKATVLNTCNEPIASLMSNVESNIALKVTKSDDGSLNMLTWNAYKKFNGDIKEYNLYRVRADIGKKFITSTTGTIEKDNLFTLEDKQTEELVCYYVEAVEENNPNGVNGRSVSNLACMTLSALDQIVMPKYLTLGPDCKSRAANPFIFPGDVIAPEKYLMVIFDRWGTKVFETENVSEGWDGTLSNGSIAPQGGYVYYIKFTSKTGPVAEKRGTVVVLCP